MKLQKNYQISGKMNSHICLIVCVWSAKKSYSLLQDLTGLENYQMSGKMNSYICLILGVWLAKKSYITRFSWAWNSNFYEGQ